MRASIQAAPRLMATAEARKIRSSRELENAGALCHAAEMKRPHITGAEPGEPFFKGWAKPGPVPPGAGQHWQEELESEETLDAISGHFRLYQLKKGHRFSTDDVLTAWYGTSWAPTARTVLDLGSGIGSVGMIAAWRLPGAHFVTIEAQPESVRLARKSRRYNGLEERYEIREGDFRDPELLEPGRTFDLVLGSPPYFPLGSGIEGDHPQKVACRFEVRGNIAHYCATAAAHLGLGGWFACVFPTEQLARVETAARESGLVIVRRRPIVLREGEPPLLTLFAMVRAGDLPEAMRQRTWVEPALIIRQINGHVHPEYAAVKLSFGFPP
ncbi:MAG: Methyltransferase small [Chthoniobacteraceae bacterium]|nr:Methyltransferase small [Chthoniobacteraceae bacterium]